MTTDARPQSTPQTIEMMVNMGPQHPSTHGVFRMVLQVDGERVTGMESVIGYLHRGTEKLAEGEMYRQVITLFDRLDYLANFNNEHTFVMVTEKLMGVKPPERAEFIRVILLELNRIASHLMYYAAFGADTGVFGTTFMYGFRERERIQAVFEAVSGARMMHNFMRVGGVKNDLPANFDAMMGDLMPVLERGVRECDDLLTTNEIFLERTQGIGVISAADAVNLGLSGPNLRACGVPYDVRRAEPYSIYDKLDFDVPVGARGDCFDRYLVRMEEMRQSLRILKQAMKGLPAGPVMATNVPKGLRPPKGEAFVCTENPRGEFGVYVISDGKDRPYRLKIRGPSFVNLMSLPTMMRNAYIADAVVILASIDIVLGDVDR